MSRSEAIFYLARVSGEHLGVFLFAFGWMIAAAGASASVAGVLAIVGLAMFVLAILSGALAGFRRRTPGMPLFGVPSIQNESNRLTGWYYLPEACTKLDLEEQSVRRLWKSLTVATIAAIVLGVAAAIVRG